MKKKVLIATPCLLPGGTEIQTINLARALVTGGYPVTVCCYYEHDENMIASFQNTGAEVILMGLERSQGLLLLAKKLISVFKGIKPDIVHVQYMAPGLVPVVAAKISGIEKIFATVHQPGRTYGFQAKALLRSAAFLCNAFFCVSLAAEKSWFGSSELFGPQAYCRGRRKHYTIYNAVDVRCISEVIKNVQPEALKNELKIENCPVIGVVGRLREEKGQDILFRALPIIIQSHSNVCLLVVGDGPDRQSLENLSITLGVQNHIRWAGQKEPSSVISYYAVMDVIAIPSRFEGFGLVAAEAMAAGVPVVASGVDGLNEIVTHGGTGYLVPSTDIPAMADRIVDILSDPEKAARFGRQARKKVAERFSVDSFRETTLDAYRKIP